jgi:ADP-ribose pyrophosphatase YjhB (NUDIX family)
MKNYIATAWIILIKDNKILLVKHLEKAWYINWVYWLPAWRFEENESEIECAIRELNEETNLETKEECLIKIPKIYYASIERKSWEIKDYSMVVFKCTNFSWELKSNDETLPLWIDLDKLDELNLLPNLKVVINDNLSL